MFEKLMTHFRSAEKNAEHYRKMGLKLGKGGEILNGWDFGSEPYLIEIGDNVRITSGVKFVTHDGGVWVLRHMYPELSDVDLFGKIHIGNNVHIGFNAIIMPGVSIGDNCLIGCGAIVTHDIPANSIAVGVPARVIESIDDYKAKHMDDFMHTKKMSADKKKTFVLHHLE
ncbi:MULTISPECIES: acyltransferase [unclassified Bifidobacterium]|uniref:acyltransferase n=1 Tax=unclassified Bifidobacterium TaxID=2608897 RepID=UPI00112A78EE|nr:MULTISPECIES: acyltransferase [unclassified Bifidobacterium]TPF78524.1 capsule biosynthesis protein CapG [Bifidobacterium sp. UTCIF-1]TPF80804.1 capsule biosynthesis protein CapG [Bifidobacterium sp. UTCIF-24]TPF82756.1 capsule biosynthesis protein CapG [Bifidobacterium sp. UTCIF-3]TPF84471.1 capsule biosynthesis protein CapG [Bifidobacterium sp. UTCIF-36]TPF90969.1 capsule biosynthesis protein CapG [Bifidobacterium sp. UTBIF-56]